MYWMSYAVLVMLVINGVNQIRIYLRTRAQPLWHVVNMVCTVGLIVWIPSSNGSTGSMIGATLLAASEILRTKKAVAYYTGLDKTVNEKMEG